MITTILPCLPIPGWFIANLTHPRLNNHKKKKKKKKQGLVNVTVIQLNITQLKRGYNFQPIFEGYVKQMPKKGHLPTTTKKHTDIGPQRDW